MGDVIVIRITPILQFLFVNLTMPSNTMKDKIFGVYINKNEIIEFINYWFHDEDSLDGLDIDISKTNIHEINHEDYAEYGEVESEIIEDYVIIFTEKQLPKQHFTIFKSNVKNIDCNISTLYSEDDKSLIIIYQSEEFSDLTIEDMKDVVAYDLTHINEKLAFLPYMVETQKDIDFYTDIIDKYLQYLDRLINYDDFRKKL